LNIAKRRFDHELSAGGLNGVFHAFGERRVLQIPGKRMIEDGQRNSAEDGDRQKVSDGRNRIIDKRETPNKIRL
jgi:hypothetical protein